MRNVIVTTKRLVIFPQCMEELHALYEKEADPEMKQVYFIQKVRKAAGCNAYYFKHTLEKKVGK